MSSKFAKEDLLSKIDSSHLRGVKRADLIDLYKDLHADYTKEHGTAKKAVVRTQTIIRDDKNKVQDIVTREEIV